MTTAVSADSYKAEPLHSGQKVPEFGMLNEVPESQVWNNEEGNYKGQALEDIGAEVLPLIDLAKADAPKLVKQCCKSSGFFQITNHGIPLAVLQNMESASVDLFSLPMEQKMKAAREPGSLTGYGIFPIASYLRQNVWSECFTVFGSPLQHAHQIWPDQSPEHSKFCAAPHTTEM
ncbi:gibberellin 3-beta-dioxygenase 1-like isoform X1 [Malania oleifera]|uniref:gibberellin 3-beta-dioxygenase 1-like isoform X1 n=1 Tax=Malania oleifera TaxID=397392 RepID=UPI0025AE66BE|nr:gibberellin 3-beta-dioxygenase 1-like isoform X1 [Malania oleifera]